jgi:hypothetical protein
MPLVIGVWYNELGCYGNDVAPRPSAIKANQEWALSCWFGSEKFDGLYRVTRLLGPDGLALLDEFRAIDNQWFEQYRRENDHIPDIRKMVLDSNNNGL